MQAANQLIKTDTDAATVAMDFSANKDHTVTLGGNRTFTFSGVNVGDIIGIFITQDATGSRTVSWPTIKWAGGSAPTLTTTASKTDCVYLRYDGTSYFDVAITKNH